MFRKLSLLTIVLTTLFVSVNAQESETAITGEITLPDNTKLTGTIKDNIRKKGEVTIEVGGKKKKYKAGEVASVQIGTTKFISSNYAFYEVLSTHGTSKVLRKANEPSDIQYNGNDPIVITSEGKVDDIFIQANNTPLLLINKKNANEVLGKVCAAYVNQDLASFNAEFVSRTLNNCK